MLRAEWKFRCTVFEEDRRRNRGSDYFTGRSEFLSVRPLFAQFFLIALPVQKTSRVVYCRRRSTTGKYFADREEEENWQSVTRDSDFDGSHWVFDDPQTHIFASFFFQFSSQIYFIDPFRITSVFFKTRLNSIKGNSFKFYSSANERKIETSFLFFLFFFIYEGKDVELNRLINEISASRIFIVTN